MDQWPVCKVQMWTVADSDGRVARQQLYPHSHSHTHTLTHLQLMERNYHHANPYHNSTHAADVLQSTAYMVNLLQDHLISQGVSYITLVTWHTFVREFHLPMELPSKRNFHCLHYHTTRLHVIST